MKGITTIVSKLQFFRRVICTIIFFLQKNQVFGKNSNVVMYQYVVVFVQCFIFIEQVILNKYKVLNKYNYIFMLQCLHISLKIVSKDAECYYKMHPINAVILFIKQKNSSKYFSLIVLDLYTISIF